jgi:hypothetical protein
MKNAYVAPKLADHLEHVMDLPDQDVLPFAAWYYGSPSALEGTTRRMSGRSPARFEPLDTPDQVRMGLACLAGNAGAVRGLLDKNPALLHLPCVMVGQQFLLPVVWGQGDLAMLVRKDPFEVSMAARTWSVGTCLVEALVAATPDNATSKDRARQRLWFNAALLASVKKAVDARPDESPVLEKIITVLLSHGADPLRGNMEGHTPLSVALLALTRAVERDNPEVRLSLESHLETTALLMDAVTAKNGFLTDERMGAKEKAHLVKELDAPFRYIVPPHHPVHVAPQWEPINTWLRKTTQTTKLAMPDSPSILWGWLFEKGLRMDSVWEVARKHRSPVMPMVDRQRLEESLPAANPAMPVTRLRL